MITQGGKFKVADTIYFTIPYILPPSASPSTSLAQVNHNPPYHQVCRNLPLFLVVLQLATQLTIILKKPVGHSQEALSLMVSYVQN